MDSRRDKKGKIVIVEGLVGSGKSTLCQSVRKHIDVLTSDYDRCVVLRERICSALLDMYIGDMQRYAFPFQVIMVRDRCEDMRTAMREAEAGALVLLDRGLPGDMAFALLQHEQGIMSDKEFSVYLELLHASHPHFVPTLIDPQHAPSPAQDAKPGDGISIEILYLRCQPQIAFERMRKRNIKSEVDGYTEAYFENLNAAYERIIQAFSDSPNGKLYVVDYSKDVCMADTQLSAEQCKSTLGHVLK